MFANPTDTTNALRALERLDAQWAFYDDYDRRRMLREAIAALATAQPEAETVVDFAGTKFSCLRIPDGHTLRVVGKELHVVAQPEAKPEGVDQMIADLRGLTRIGTGASEMVWWDGVAACIRNYESTRQAQGGGEEGGV